MAGFHRPPSRLPPDQADAEQTSEEIVRAIEASKEKEEEATAAKQDVRDLAERIVRLEKDIQLEQESLTLVHQRIENLRKDLREKQIGLTQKIEAGVRSDDLHDLQQKVSQTQTGISEAEAEFQAKNDRIDDLRLQMYVLKEELSRSEIVSEAKSAEAEAAKFGELIVTVRVNIVNWFRLRGPRVVIAVAIAVLLGLSVKLTALAMNWLLSLLRSRGAVGKRERAQTVVQMVNSALTVCIIAGGVLITLHIAGIPFETLLGSAAVVGLAVAFAAQNLIRDYFHGVIIMLENQYALNDEVTINGMTGRVDMISLRLTLLRDFEGNTHFIPNGQITTVTNHSQLWSRVVLKITINASQDLDEITRRLLAVGQELRKEQDYGEWTLDDHEMLGISELGGSSVTLKFGVKTRPDKKYAVKLELQRRIQLWLDEIAAHPTTAGGTPVLS